jgi:hypothetical protein
VFGGAALGGGDEGSKREGRTVEGAASSERRGEKRDKGSLPLLEVREVDRRRERSHRKEKHLNGRQEVEVGTAGVGNGKMYSFVRVYQS